MQFVTVHKLNGPVHVSVAPVGVIARPLDGFLLGDLLALKERQIPLGRA